MGSIHSSGAQSALQLSRDDWKADSVNVLKGKTASRVERTPIDDVKYRFRAASYTLGTADWQSLFQQYDKDGNGELDEDEFAKAVRKYVSESQLSDKELKLLFRDVDKDGGGSIGPAEFEEFFFQGTLNQPQFFASMW